MYSNKNIPAPFNQPQCTNSRKENSASQLPTPTPSKNHRERVGKQMGFQMESAGEIHFHRGEQQVSRLLSRRNLPVFPAVLLIKILILTRGEKKSSP